MCGEWSFNKKTPQPLSVFQAMRGVTESQKPSTAQLSRLHTGALAKGSNDAQTNVLPTRGSAMCVQKFDDSRCLAIHITYRVSLRSSSLREPRHPLLKVISCFSSFLKKDCLSTIPENLGAGKSLRREVSLVVFFVFSCVFVVKKGCRGKKKKTVPKNRLPLKSLQFSYPHVSFLESCFHVLLILPQVHLRKPCYDFSFL
jgi:hypothetical protein